MIPSGRLYVPAGPRASFHAFYDALAHLHPDLFERILSPTGPAKAASTTHLTPIKEITRLSLEGYSLPGDGQWYGWNDLQAEAGLLGLELQIQFQGNGLFYNRGSIFFDGEKILDAPNAYLAAMLQHESSTARRVQLAADGETLKRPILLFVNEANGNISSLVFTFLSSETYLEGIRRLEAELRIRGALAAFAASPPLILPDTHNEPYYLSLPEIIAGYHANDVRHWLYCPYEGAVLFSAELGRMQCLKPDELARVVANSPHAILELPLAETLNFFQPSELRAILERKGYRGHYTLGRPTAPTESPPFSISPLEGVYSHLLPFLTRQGQFGLIQTSGTHGNVTGNDGPTQRQLSAILRDLNTQPPFDGDPIIAASSGSQGNDVPNIICRGKDGQPDFLSHLCPPASLEVRPALRGIVTTPRIAIALPA